LFEEIQGNQYQEQFACYNMNRKYPLMAIGIFLVLWAFLIFIMMLVDDAFDDDERWVGILGNFIVASVFFYFSQKKSRPRKNNIEEHKKEQNQKITSFSDDKKHCSSCNNIVENNAKFCSSCGNVMEDVLKQESKRMEHANEVKQADRKVTGIGLILVGLFILLVGFGILISAMEMPTIFAGQYVLLAVFVLVIGVMTIYAGQRVSRKKKGQYLCIYCRYIAETDRELHNHELTCERKLKHDKLNK